MNIIFDLDGTIIDASERLYQLFQHLVPMSQWSKEEYWNRKRNKENHEMIINKYFSDIDFGQFNKQWLQLIETEDFLNLDRNYSDTTELLKELSTKSSLFLLTARQSKKGLIDELKRLQINEYFENIFVTENLKSKADLLDEIMENGDIKKGADDLFVSDMGKDIVIGKKRSFITIGISHGFMCRDRLKEYCPDYLVDELMEIVEIVNLRNQGK